MARRNRSEEEVLSGIRDTLRKWNRESIEKTRRARQAADKSKFSPDNIERLVRLIDNGPTDEEIRHAVMILRRLMAKVDAEVELEQCKREFDRLWI